MASKESFVIVERKNNGVDWFIVKYWDDRTSSWTDNVKEATGFTNEDDAWIVCGRLQYKGLDVVRI